MKASPTGLRLRLTARGASFAVAALAALVGCGDGSLASDASMDAADVGDAAGHGDGGDARAPVDADLDAADALDAAPAALSAVAGASRYALVGEEVILDGSASTGAVLFSWSFGDGTGWIAPRGESLGRVTYRTPGRYRAVLTVIDEAGNRRSDGLVVSVTSPLSHTPRASTALLPLPDGRVALASTDSNEVVVFHTEADTYAEDFRRATAAGPRTLALWGDLLAVPCQDADLLELHPLSGTGAAFAVALPRGSRPYGAVAAGDALYVSLQGTGELARVIRAPGGTAILDGRLLAVPDARGVAVLPDGRLAVTRWRSPESGGQVAFVDTDTLAVETVTLAVDPQAGSDTESGGVPSYLEAFVVSPTGDLAVVPSLQAATGEGLFRSPRPLTHETTVRAVLSFVDLSAGAEDFEARKQFDDRGFAAAAALSARGDFAFVAMRGSRAVERYDLLSRSPAGSILSVGFAPDAIALSADDSRLYVHASLSRELVVYDVTDFSALPRPLARLPVVTAEPLDPQVFRGKQLFNDSLDPRLGRDGYIACAHCHLEGMADDRTWDFTDRGEGLRNTIDLLGHAGAGHGPIHWSGNFDEIQDFEHDLRGPFRGTGLMDDADFAAGTRGQSLGDPKAGVSEDLDALAAYVTSLDSYLASPWREPDGSLPAAARRGREIFRRPAQGCTTCHTGPRLTDSRFITPGAPLLHDVGTLHPGSGGRLGGALSGIDTPTLHGLWQSAPYLHDGSAASLREVLTGANVGDAHGVTSTLSTDELDDLVSYLRCLDGRGD